MDRLKTLSLLGLLVFSLLQFACAEEDPTNLVPYVTGLTVIEENGKIFLDVEGELPFKCAIFQNTEQLIQGKTIIIKMKAAVPEGESCPRNLSEFSENIELDTSNLEPGKYTIDVHNILADVDIQ